MRPVRWRFVVLVAGACTAARAQAAAPPAAGAPPDPAADLRAADLHVRGLAQSGLTEASQQSPLATVAIDSGYGGIAGLLVGTGVALAEGDHWARDLSVGAGVGLIVGAAVGIVHATVLQPRYASAGAPPRAAAKGDGLGRTDRDPVIPAPAPLALAGRF